HRTPTGAAALGAMLAAGRLSCPWELTVSEFLSRRLSWLPASVRDDIVLPWIAFLNNNVLPLALESSARAALAFFGRPAPMTSIDYCNAANGLGSIADHLPLKNARLDSEVTEISRTPQGFQVGEDVYDELVLAVPASTARKLLTGVLERDLNDFQETRSTLAIH